MSDRYPPIQFCFAILLLCEIEGKGWRQETLQALKLESRIQIFSNGFFKGENQHL